MNSGLGAKAIGARYPAKKSNLNTLKSICRRIDKTGSAVIRQTGSGRPKSARTSDNVAAVGDMICSQEDKPGTSKSTRRIAKVVGISDRSVRRIAKNDLQLSAYGACQLKSSLMLSNLSDWSDAENFCILHSHISVT